MTEEELLRYEIVSKLIKKEIKAKEVSLLLNLSIRQIKRLKVKVREKGAEGLISAPLSPPRNWQKITR